MKQFGILLISAASVCAVMVQSPASGSASDRRLEAALKRLDPDTRLIQVCDLTAMQRIDRDPNRFHPDHVMIDQLSSVHRTGNTLQGSGAVFRSGGNWYHLSFTCKAADDHLSVLDFTYKIGAKIDRSRWSALNLFP